MKKIFIILFTLALPTINIVAKNSKPIYAELTFATHSIWHGWDINSNKPVFHPYLEYSIGKTGLSIATWSSLPINRELSENDDIEFLLRYKTSFFKGKRYESAINSFVDYIVCPNAYLPKTDGTEQTKMLWKYNIGFSLPSLVKIGSQTINMAYNLFYFYPFGDIDFKSGSVHEVSSSYTVPILKGINIAAATNYHSGVFSGGTGWTHATATLSKSFKLGSFNLKTAINKQWSFNQRTDIEDEFWATVGINKKF